MNEPTPRPHLAPLRDGAFTSAEWRLLVEHRRILRLELADLEIIMEGVFWEMIGHGEARA